MKLTRILTDAFENVILQVEAQLHYRDTLLHKEQKQLVLESKIYRQLNAGVFSGGTYIVLEPEPIKTSDIARTVRAISPREVKP